MEEGLNNSLKSFKLLSKVWNIYDILNAEDCIKAMKRLIVIWLQRLLAVTCKEIKKLPEEQFEATHSRSRKETKSSNFYKEKIITKKS